MKKKTKYVIRRIILLIILLSIIAAAFYAVNGFMGNDKNGDSRNVTNIPDDTNINPANQDDNNEDVEQTKVEETKMPEDIEITISAVGDIMFHPRQINGAYDEVTDTYNFKPYFEPIKSIIESADLAIGNFEGTTAGKEMVYQGYPLFNAPDDVLDAIKYAGFDVLSTVNNHSLDMRKTGVIRTIEKMDERELAHVGTYIEKPDTRVLMQEVKGIKLAFLAYTEMLNGLDSVLSADDLDAMINKIDRNKIKEDIAYAKENDADLIIMIIHWGDEYLRTPNVRQTDLKDFLIAEGVDIIFGSHPHVIQDCEDFMYNGKRVFVAYSSGNFISNQRTEEELPAQTEDGVITTLSIKKSGETGVTTIEDINFTPTWVYRAKQEGKTTFTYRILPIMEYIESEDYSDSAKDRMRRSYNDTMSKLDKEFN